MAIVLNGTTGITAPDIDVTAQASDITTTGDITAVDATLSGGVYLGGTGAANKLDDYEEGTWTPVGNNITFAVAQGTYTKIGRQVIATFRIQFPSTSDTSTAYVSTTAGMPFSGSGSYVNYRGGGYVSFTNSGYPDLGIYYGSQFQITNDGGSNYTNANLSGKKVTGVLIYITD